MQLLSVTGGAPLCGAAVIHGAKNSALPILAASILSGGPCVLRNCPAIDDVRHTLQILQALGAECHMQGGTVFVHADLAGGWQVPAALAGKMRSSVIFLGALLARHKRARIALPGGCPLGDRPIDLHIGALEQMGAEFTYQDNEILCTAERLRGCRIALPFPSVGATENILLAATACKGTVVLENAAQEPEITDLVQFLRSMGAEIRGADTATLTIRGGAPLTSATYTILPDRIETATYLAAVAACGGDVTLQRTRQELLLPITQLLRGCGCEITAGSDTLRIVSSGHLQAPTAPIVTQPYPGFPTDAQAPMMAALLRAKGESAFAETVFSSRFRHVPELRKLGAEILTQGSAAYVRGVERLHGARVCAEDLRGGAALVIAALQSEENCQIMGVKHLNRGYDSLVEGLQKLGADIKCVENA